MSGSPRRRSSAPLSISAKELSLLHNAAQIEVIFKYTGEELDPKEWSGYIKSSLREYMENHNEELGQDIHVSISIRPGSFCTFNQVGRKNRDRSSRVHSRHRKSKGK